MIQLVDDLSDPVKKLVRQSQIVQSAMYSHMYDAVIITQFVYKSCHSLKVGLGF